jgi:hypothetical protein
LRAFVESHAPVRRVLEFWDRDFNRVRFENPFVPLFALPSAQGLWLSMRMTAGTCGRPSAFKMLRAFRRSDTLMVRAPGFLPDLVA